MNTKRQRRYLGYLRYVSLVGLVSCSVLAFQPSLAGAEEDSKQNETVGSLDFQIYTSDPIHGLNGRFSSGESVVYFETYRELSDGVLIRDPQENGRNRNFYVSIRLYDENMFVFGMFSEGGEWGPDHWVDEVDEADDSAAKPGSSLNPGMPQLLEAAAQHLEELKLGPEIHVEQEKLANYLEIMSEMFSQPVPPEVGTPPSIDVPEVLPGDLEVSTESIEKPSKSANQGIPLPVVH